MRQTLWIKGKFPNLNDIILESRKNKYGAANQKKTWTNLVAMTARDLRPMTRVWIKFIWHEKNRKRDPDNIAAAKKFILDGLKDAGVLENDGWKQISGFTDCFEISKTPGVLVELEGV